MGQTNVNVTWKNTTLMWTSPSLGSTSPSSQYGDGKMPHLQKLRLRDPSYPSCSFYFITKQDLTPAGYSSHCRPMPPSTLSGNTVIRTSVRRVESSAVACFVEDEERQAHRSHRALHIDRRPFVTRGIFTDGFLLRRRLLGDDTQTDVIRSRHHPSPSWFKLARVLPLGIWSFHPYPARRSR